ncbi:hypothetical protein ACO0SA_001548 [Hanseniaspora valbyensis]
MQYLTLLMLLLTIVEAKPIHTDREQTSLKINNNKRKDYSNYNLIRCDNTYYNKDININLDDLWMKNDDYMEFMVHENDIDSYKDCKMLGNIQDMINEEFESMFFDNEDDDEEEEV